MKKVRVLVIDDSLTMRSLIVSKLMADARLEVIGTAANVSEARTKIKMLNPDVITLDVEMPGMNGLEFLEKIMRLRPFPVVMVSTTTHVGSMVSIQALEIGAVDCIAKPNGRDDSDFEGIADRVYSASKANLGQSKGPSAERVTPVSMAQKGDIKRVIAIGASTGGVDAIATVLKEFPSDCPPVVIAIHLPGMFTKTYAERLARTCAPEVVEASDGLVLRNGLVAIAPGSETHLVVDRYSRASCKLVQADKVNGHRPSVDVLFHSVAQSFGGNGIGIILTGMGRDGADGLSAMRRAGAVTIGQDERTSLIYGMPRVAFEIGAVEKQVALNSIAAEVAAICRRQNLEG